jgi:hypothetical protein
VRLGRSPRFCYTFEAQAGHHLSPLEVICDSFDAARAEYVSRMVLVRPDQYVVLAGDEPPRDPVQLMRKAIGCV